MGFDASLAEERGLERGQALANLASCYQPLKRHRLREKAGE